MLLLERPENIQKLRSMFKNETFP